MNQLQTQDPILPRLTTDSAGRFRLNDLHVICGLPHKAPGQWHRVARTKEIIKLLTEERATNATRISEAAINNDLAPILVYEGAHLPIQGTFAVRELVIDYARWISPEFHLRLLREFQQRDSQQAPTRLSLPLAMTVIGQTNLATVLEAIEQLPGALRPKGGGELEAAYRALADEEVEASRLRAALAERELNIVRLSETIRREEAEQQARETRIAQIATLLISTGERLSQTTKAIAHEPDQLSLH